MHDPWSPPAAGLDAAARIEGDPIARYDIRTAWPHREQWTLTLFADAVKLDSKGERPHLFETPGRRAR
jgi:hypothetical protein